jgi:hypothetical protein
VKRKPREHGGPILDDRAFLSFLEGRYDSILGQPRDFLQGVEPEVTADHGSDSEHLIGVFTQAVEPPANDVAETLGDHRLRAGVLRPGLVAAALAIDDALLYQVPENLLHEQRVTFRLTPDQLRLGPGDLLATYRLVHTVHFVDRQAAQGDALERPAAAQLSKGARQRCVRSTSTSR